MEQDGRQTEREGRLTLGLTPGFKPVVLDEGGDGPVDVDDEPGGGSCVGVAMRLFDGELRGRQSLRAGFVC